MADTNTIIEGPASYVVTRKVKPDAIDEYESWLLEVGNAARAVDPSLSMTVIRPGGHRTSEYVVVLHFSDHEKLDEWEAVTRARSCAAASSHSRRERQSGHQVPLPTSQSRSTEVPFG